MDLFFPQKEVSADDEPVISGMINSILCPSKSGITNKTSCPLKNDLVNNITSHKFDFLDVNCSVANYRHCPCYLDVLGKVRYKKFLKMSKTKEKYGKILEKGTYKIKVLEPNAINFHKTL